ncbi:MAG: hypothetical protein ACI9BC_002429, partial [Crocinitomicaceae bacterium]
MLAVMRKITPVSMVGTVSAGDDLPRSGDAVTVDALDYRHDICLRQAPRFEVANPFDP